MDGKIAIEEHFVTPRLERVVGNVGWSPDEWRRVIDRLSDIHGRLRLMDEHGVELQLLSLASDGINGIPERDDAVATAREANDALAEMVAKYPTRFAGLAALPLQDAEASAEEITRAVRELGLKGALVNGYSSVGNGNGKYLDEPEYLGFWERVSELGVPLYLHPRDPLPGQRRIYEGRPQLLGATWAFAVETGTHALRLITSGLFDRLPDLQIVLGHLGENLPFAVARVEQRMAHVPTVKLERGPLAVFGENFYVTTSGNYHTQSLLGVLLVMGSERVLFATDYPFEEMRDGTDWFDQAPISESDRLKIGRTNALSLFGLEAATTPVNGGAGSV